MQHNVVSQSEWLKARKTLLAKGKEFSKTRDALSAARRALPWTPVEKNYVFDGPNGKETLSDLFGGKSQLIIYHFMLGPGWVQGCPSCSFLVDNIGHLSHLHARDTTLALVSRAPLAKVLPFKRRMGWTVPWYSSFGSDFTSVLIYVEPDVERRRQMFSDMNATPKVVAKALNVYFDSRSPFARAAQAIANEHPLLAGNVEMQGARVPAGSPKYYTLGAVFGTLKRLQVGANGRVRLEQRYSEEAIRDRGDAFFSVLGDTRPEFEEIRSVLRPVLEEASERLHCGQ